MSGEEASSVMTSTRMLWAAAGMAAAILIAGAVVTLSPHPAQATAAYTAQTKLPCGKCHVNPAGGGPRNDFGNAFAANGHKLPKQ